ncbi:hypothetical protein Misp01_06410 [Microtetraspora sp. NBRC 13810]|uniref:hypothetical protein n=1 Tax=Microtetraspora sp. NBRC 13810 TaxID=3030990 RepID=UPI0024A42B64|nr:hypothetical protein [Microtetraspora sp. NBRC 13810]GLW05511.1 hypothetical protein Misp01_06410 [Microtetraspora sp. NBRC 13810]
MDALKNQFKSNTGVKFLTVEKSIIGGKSSIFADVKGAYQFGASGISASDTTLRLRIDDETRDSLEELSETEEGEVSLLEIITSPMRLVSTKKGTYLSTPAIAPVLPEGKSWVGLPSSTLGGRVLVAQTLNVLEPATLKALLSDVSSKKPGGNVDGARTTLYTGKLTYGELYKVSPALRQLGKLDKSQAKSVVNWQLWLDAKNLPRRVVNFTDEKVSGVTTRSVSDTRYTGWGSRLTIKTPPAAEVLTEKDALQEIPELPQLFNVIK